MLLPAPPLYPRKRKPRPKARRSAPPAAALTLVSAAYEPSAAITLTFDRPIDIASLVGSAIVIEDGVVAGFSYTATGPAELTGPASVLIELAAVQEFTGPGVTMTAGAGNGIVAQDDGGTWAGVVGLALPFP